MGRNKKSCVIDLRTPKGQDLVRQMMVKSDVVLENFRPGVMEKWGLGPEDLHALHPDLIYTRISGYGQDGPYSNKAGYAAVCEAFGGLRHITGFPNQPPVRSNISIGDSLAGLHAAFGTVMALLVRDKLKHAGSGGGQVVDVAIYESVFNMLESIVPEYDRFNMIREPSGTTITGVVPSGTWQCKDGTYIVVGGNGDSVYQRLMEAIGRPDMVGGAFATNADRMNNLEAIDEALAAWTRQHDAQDAIEHLEKARVPVGKIYTVKDMFHDEHYKSRKLLETVDVHGSPLTIPAILPKLSRTKGSTEWAGPDLGVHTRQVLQELLGMQEEELAVLEQEGVIQT